MSDAGAGVVASRPARVLPGPITAALLRVLGIFVPGRRLELLPVMVGIVQYVRQEQRQNSWVYCSIERVVTFTLPLRVSPDR